MMHKVALAALLAAPSALAFTPADLQGVWSCVVKDGFKQTKIQDNTVATYKAFDSPDDAKILRVVVFDKPDNSKATRRLSGRTYYTYNDKTEEHNFHGLMKNAVEGDFYLDPNGSNVECNGALTPSPPIQTTDAKKDHYHYRIDTYGKAAIGNGGSCNDAAQGPWSFTVDDPDHLSLQVHEGDLQLDNWPLDDTAGVTVGGGVAGWTSNHGYAKYPRIFVTEKCMRGLPLKSKMCALLARSSITSQEDMDRACSRDLVCAQSTSSQSWGCNGHKCCDVRGYVPPPVYNYPSYPSYQYPSYGYPSYGYPSYGASYGSGQSWWG